MKDFIVKMGAVLVVLLTASASYAGTLKDSRDGKTYKTVQIGDKVWMAENLNFDYNHGTAKSMCYDNKPENCEKYGRLYTWAAAMDSAAIFSKEGARCGYGKECDAIGTVRGVCPEGWHLPSKEELEELETIAGDEDKAGLILKSRQGWIEYKGGSGNGTDGLGFGALPAGSYVSVINCFNFEGNYAIFWSSTEHFSNYAYRLFLGYGKDANVRNLDKGYGFSVRCVKN